MYNVTFENQYFITMLFESFFELLHSRSICCCIVQCYTKDFLYITHSDKKSRSTLEIVFPLWSDTFLSQWSFSLTFNWFNKMFSYYHVVGFCKRNNPHVCSGRQFCLISPKNFFIVVFLSTYIFILFYTCSARLKLVEFNFFCRNVSSLGFRWKLIETHLLWSSRL